jgi:cytochrome c peroxidase
MAVVTSQKSTRISVLRALVVIGVAGTGCGKLADDVFCDGPTCNFTRYEWGQVQALAGLREPDKSLDPSNKWLDVEPAIQLGWRFYYETAFAGKAQWQDTLGRPTASARAPLGTKMEISCASCHDPQRAGSDFTSRPGHVSEGAGWYDVNAQQVLNAGHYPLLYWNGRSDSLWAQAAAVMESDVSVNGNRMEIVRTVLEKYRTQYEAVFGPEPLVLPPRAEIEALMENPESGPPVCKGGPQETCPAGCRHVVATNPAALPDLRCWPIFPLRGKGGQVPGCQVGAEGAKEPFHDAFECMQADATVNQVANLNRIYSNIAKAIAAYEFELTSLNSAFDRYAAGDRGALSPAAERGLKLFVGRASCIDCHRTPLFSDGAFHNIGVPQAGPAVPTERECVAGGKCDCTTTRPEAGPVSSEPALLPQWPAAKCLPWGYYTGLARLHSPTFRRDGPFSDNAPAGKISHKAYYDLADAPTPPTTAIGAWRTPSLRDVALTPPYMHDGIFATLDEVIWSVELKPLFLSAQDRQDLVEFLKSLTGAPSRGELHGPPPPVPPTTP